MSVWKKIITYIALIGLIGYTIGISVLALLTGEMRDRFSWIQFDKSPVAFIFSLVGTIAFTIILLVILYMLYYYERYLVYIASRIWEDYKKLIRRRL